MIGGRRLGLALRAVGVARPRLRQQLAGRHQALLALAGAGAQAGEALDLLDVEVAIGERLLQVDQGHIFAAADDDLV